MSDLNRNVNAPAFCLFVCLFVLHKSWNKAALISKLYLVALKLSLLGFCSPPPPPPLLQWLHVHSWNRKARFTFDVLKQQKIFIKNLKNKTKNGVFCWTAKTEHSTKKEKKRREREKGKYFTVLKTAMMSQFSWLVANDFKDSPG